MEKAIEFEGEIDREKEISTSARAVIDNVTDTRRQRSALNSLSCGTSQRKCRLTEQVVAESDTQLSDLLITERKSTSKAFHNFKLTMLLQYSKEFLGFLALVLTTYATLLNKEPIIGGTLSPRPIFAKDSIVQEWPNGNLGDVQSKVAVSELSLIFFYAPWCAESLFARKVYNAVANLYSREIYFAAVNCWQPNSSCRTFYSNVYKWPVLMAYMPNGFSVQYNGAWSYNSLTQFIDGLMTPFVRIHDLQNLKQLRITNDAVVFGVLDSCDSKEYQLFFQTAVKWLENSSFQNVKFAVYIGRDTSRVLPSDSNQPPVIKLFTTNDTIVYNNTKWVPKQIINFVQSNLVKSSIWINFSSTKSSTFNKYLQRGPVLLMFSPRISSSHHYLIMKQLIYSHQNYQQDINNTVLNEYITNIQREYPAKLKKLKRFCEFAKKVENNDIPNALYNVGVWGGKLLSLGLHTVNTSKSMPSKHHLNSEGNSCDRKYCEAETFVDKIYQISSAKRVVDYRSPSELLRNYLQKQLFQLEKLPQALSQKDLVEHIKPSKMLGPDQVRNRTLTFLMLDSMEHNDFLRNFIGEFGIRENPFLSSALFIIDNDGESLYMHKSLISTNIAMNFLNDYYKGRLRRHLRSSRFAESNKNSSVDSSVIVKEINSRQFAAVIRATNVTSVVLFYSPKCSLCYIMSSTLLHVSYMMQLRNIKFYRMDASSNDLSWEYTMNKYPTLIVFPKNRSIDTNVFPSTLKINVKNLFGFILSKLKPEQQLKSLFNACMITKQSAPFQNCVRQIRVAITNEINRYLQLWNRYPSDRNIIVKRLNMFKEVYFELIRARKGSDLNCIINNFIKFENGDYLYTF